MKIAFIDHHLENFHANTFQKILRDKTLIPQDVIIGGWELEEAGEDWCAKHNVLRLHSLEDALEWADRVMVLSPDNLDCHFSLAQQVLPAGLPTFFDKMLAPTIDDAEQIVELASRYKAPVFSSSGLSFAVELGPATDLKGEGSIHDVFVGGMGGWLGYGIHTLSMALTLMGSAIVRLIDTGTHGARTVTIDYGGGSRAVVDVRTCANEYEASPWRFIARTDTKSAAGVVTAYADFYVRLIQHVVEFFSGADAALSLHDSLTAVKVLNLADISLQRGGEWVALR